MATSVQQPTQPNGVAPHLQIVDRLDSLPLVHDSVAYAEHLLNSTQLTASLYKTAVGIAERSVSIAQPVLSRAQPLIKSADGLAVATFDRVEATFPYIKTPTEDLVGVKQAKAVYDARVVPLIQQATPVIQEVVNKTTAINAQLGARASSAIQQSTELSHHLLEQLHALTEQGKDLPHQLLEGLGKVTSDVKAIVLAKEGTVQEKTNKLGAYVVEQVKPVVDEIYRHVLGATGKTSTADKPAVADADKPKDKASAAPAPINPADEQLVPVPAKKVATPAAPAPAKKAPAAAAPAPEKSA